MEFMSDNDKLALARATFQAGQAIYRTEGRFRSIFFVRTGEQL
jgi:hypothetical protein